MLIFCFSVTAAAGVPLHSTTSPLMLFRNALGGNTRVAPVAMQLGYTKLTQMTSKDLSVEPTGMASVAPASPLSIVETSEVSELKERVLQAVRQQDLAVAPVAEELSLKERVLQAVHQQDLASLAAATMAPVAQDLAAATVEPVAQNLAAATMAPVAQPDEEIVVPPAKTWREALAERRSQALQQLALPAVQQRAIVPSPVVATLPPSMTWRDTLAARRSAALQAPPSPPPALPVAVASDLVVPPTLQALEDTSWRRAYDGTPSRPSPRLAEASEERGVVVPVRARSPADRAEARTEPGRAMKIADATPQPEVPMATAAASVLERVKPEQEVALEPAATVEQGTAEEVAAEEAAAEEAAEKAVLTQKAAEMIVVAEEAAAETAMAESVAADKVAAERLAAEKLAAEKLAADKAEHEAAARAAVDEVELAAMAKAEATASASGTWVPVATQGPDNANVEVWYGTGI